jgi:hypothetical protein
MPNSILKLLVSALLAALPFAFQPYVASVPLWLGALGVLGAAAGYGLGFPAAGGGIIGAATGLWLLTRSGLIGNGSEGDTFYLVGGYAAAIFVISAVMGALLRGATSRPASDPSSDHGL